MAKMAAVEFEIIAPALIRQRALELAVDTRPGSHEATASILARADQFASFIEGGLEPTCAVDEDHAVVSRSVTNSGHPDDDRDSPDVLRTYIVTGGNGEEWVGSAIDIPHAIGIARSAKPCMPITGAHVRR